MKRRVKSDGRKNVGMKVEEKEGQM